MKTTNGKARRGLFLLPVLAALILPGVSHAATSASLIQQPAFTCGSGIREQQAVKKSTFESVPSRPLALSDDGSLLYVINSQSDCLEIYQTAPGDDLKLVSTVAVGIGPVSVAVRTASEVWVVNHVSDSVSIVDIAGQPHIRRTLQVGDEPWDVAFANSPRHRNATRNYRDRAFITAAFRGQNNPQFKLQYLLLNRLDTKDGSKGELIGRADLWAFDLDDGRAPKLAGLINTFTTSLRALAVDRSGNRVFAASFKSGNRTAITPVTFDKLVGPKWSADGLGNVEPFAIVQQQKDKRWMDADGNVWPTFMNYDVSDNDLFVIDAAADLKVGNPDRPIFNRQAIAETVESIGNVLFNSYFDDAHNRLLISAVDAHNTTTMQENLKGVFVSNRLKVIDFNQKPAKVSSLDLDTLMGDAKQKPGLALPGGLLASGADGQVLVAAMGTNEVVGFNLDQALAGGGKAPSVQQVPMPGGPIAVVAGADAQTFYSYNYITDSVSIFKQSATGLAAAGSRQLYNPEVDYIQRGRRYLYDATLTSANNRVTCGSCHIFGGDDKIQWTLDRGNENIVIDRLPFIQHGDHKTAVRPIRFRHAVATSKVGDEVPLGDIKVKIKYIGDQKGFADKLDSGEIQLKDDGLAYLTDAGPQDKRLTRFKIMTNQPTWVLIETPFFHSLKGPMRTTPLYGIADSGAMHFLGDKSGLVLNKTGPCSDKSESQEERAFHEFNSPCDGSRGNTETLLGSKHLAKHVMDDFAKFSLALTYPPNPIRPLDNQVDKNGEDIFMHRKTVANLSDWDDIVHKGPLIFTCNTCHTLNRKERMFGTSREVYSAPSLSQQDAKVPHLRYLYDRAGFLRGDYRKTDQFLNMQRDLPYFDTVVAAQGLNHGGWFDFTMFFGNVVWVFDPKSHDPENKAMKAQQFDLFTYLMEFDSNYFPMYGKQLTVGRGDLHDGALPTKVTAFFADALHPRSSDQKQCQVYLSSTRTATPAAAITGVKELVGIVQSSTEPVTLTCL